MAKKIIAVASGGGHWVQLLRLRPAFEGHNVVYVCVQPDYAEDVAPNRFYSVPDVTRWTKWKVIPLALILFWILVKERPSVLITTGSAPGLIALRIAKALGVRTVWIDSIANIEKLSASGKRAGGCADLWLTQWPHLSGPDGPDYAGAVF